MLTMRRQAAVIGTLTALLWFVFAVDSVTGGSLNRFGVVPRTEAGLMGILFAPFIHYRLDHIAANTIPFAVLGWMVMLRDARHFVPVTVASVLGAGLFAWLLGASGSVHIGVSGVIFGYFGFIVVSGWYSRSLAGLLLATVVVALWGGVAVGVLPGQPGISWQSHLGGMVAGAFMARVYRTRFQGAGVRSAQKEY